WCVSVLGTTHYERDVFEASPFTVHFTRWDVCGRLREAKGRWPGSYHRHLDLLRPHDARTAQSLHGWLLLNSCSSSRRSAAPGPLASASRPPITGWPLGWTLPPDGSIVTSTWL